MEDIPSLSEEFQNYRSRLSATMPTSRREIDPFLVESFMELSQTVAVMETKLEQHLTDSSSWKTKVDTRLNYLSTTLETILREHRLVWLTAGATLGAIGMKILDKLFI